MCVCDFSTLSLYLSLQGTVAMGALTEDVLAPISPTTGWCPFIAGIDWWLVETTPVEDRPYSLQSFRHFLRIEVQTCLFSKKKRGRHIKVALFFHGVSMNYPENQVVGTWNDAIPRISQNAFQRNQFLPAFFYEFSRFHIWFGAEKYPKIVHDQLEESCCMSLIGLMSIPVVKMSSWFPSAWVFKFLK